MLKDTLFNIFKILGLILASSIIWDLIIGFYNEETASTNVYPSQFNESVYTMTIQVYSDRIYKDLDKNGQGYADATEQIWNNAKEN